jgi:5-methylcytosine-specific restriction endonuclease McrA
MKNKTINARLVWKQFEDELVPRLKLSVIDRAVYSHLFRHSRLEGKLRIRFALSWLAPGIRLCAASARQSVRYLIDQGALRLVERTTTGHVVEVRLPQEIRLPRSAAIETANGTQPANLEDADFLQNKALSQAIHARERGRCFYCLRRTNPRTQCLDHVVPRAHSGRNSYRNLVSCCQDCNARKGERSASDFLCGLYRERRLTAAQLAARLRALEALAAGKLRPALQSQGDLARKGGPLRTVLAVAQAGKNKKPTRRIGWA